MFRFGDPGGRIYTSAGTSQVNILSLWTQITTFQADWSVLSSNGRSTGSCLRCTFANGHNANALQKTLDAQATWGVALGYRISTFPTSGNYVNIISLVDNTSSQCDLRLNADGTLSVTRNGTVLGTSSVAISTNAYVHLELKILIHPSAGTVELRINGVAKIGPLTSQNTRATSNSSANVIAVGHYNASNVGSTSTNYDFDDIIVWDGQTTDANGFADIHDFIGDCGLVWLLPTGAGTTTQFTADTGSNYARVNETTPDGDTSYVQDSTVSDVDTYAMADLAASATTIKSVAAVTYARKTDVGARTMSSVLRSGGGNSTYATSMSLSNSYLYYFNNWGQNPNNGSATNWTPTTVNALEAGQTVSS